MLQLTSGATKHLMEATGRHAEEGDRVPRFARDAGQIKLGFASRPAPGDKVVDASGLRVFVAGDIVDKLDAAVIDVAEEDGRQVLVLRRQKGAGAAQV